MGLGLITRVCADEPGLGLPAEPTALGALGSEGLGLMVFEGRGHSEPLTGAHLYMCKGVRTYKRDANRCGK